MGCLDYVCIVLLLTLYFLQLLFFEGVRLGYYRPWYYGDAVLYALGTATIFHAVSHPGLYNV